MKGGFYNPPNKQGSAGIEDLRGASMKGGFYNPPNDVLPGEAVGVGLASMKGGFYNPPNVASTSLTAPRASLQ